MIKDKKENLAGLGLELHDGFIFKESKWIDRNLAFVCIGYADCNIYSGIDIQLVRVI